MKIYFVYPSDILNTLLEKWLEEAINTCFICTVENYRWYRGDRVKQFDVLCECEALVILPVKEGLTEDMLWALKVMVSLKKKTYMMEKCGNILQVHITDKPPKEAT